jgi:putative transposase
MIVWMIGADTNSTHGRLPHLGKPDRTYYVTFCTKDRRVLVPAERTAVLKRCISHHDVLHHVYIVTVMPDHVHLLSTPYECATIKRIVTGIKRGSATDLNRLRGTTGRVWQRESFDRMVRCDENRRQKAEYIAMNPVRWGLCSSPEEYEWTWMAPT